MGIKFNFVLFIIFVGGKEGGFLGWEGWRWGSIFLGILGFGKIIGWL
jgi:hypothetical protein